MKAPSPLLGFNNNVRHKGRVFHIQTEDSGIRHPHIITHLFADGGRILKTTKTSYAEHIGNERLAETVRAMMQDQHKAMFIALRDGGFDTLFEDPAGPASLKAGSKPVLEAISPAMAGVPEPAFELPHLAPVPLAAPAAPAITAPLVVLEDARLIAPTLPAQVAVVATSPADPGPAARVPPRPQPSPSRPNAPNAPNVMRPAAHYAPTEPAQLAVAAAPLDSGETLGAEDGEARLSPARRARSSRPTLDVDAGALHGVGTGDSSIDLDLDALERAAAEAQTPFFQQIQDLPPPPAAVLGSKRASTGGYSVRTPAPTPLGPRALGNHDGAGSRAQAPSLLHAPQSPGPHHAPAPSPGRYAPSRPASIFATTRPQEGASIFGEDLISEKSLDEVILSYLAEDLDGPAEKK